MDKREQSSSLFYVLYTGAGTEKGRLYPLFNTPFRDKEEMLAHREKMMGTDNLEGVFCATFSEAQVAKGNATGTEAEGAHFWGILESVFPDGEVGDKIIRRMTLPQGFLLPVKEA